MFSRLPVYTIVPLSFFPPPYSSSFYLRLCYLRWLAMGSAGGGWMSDYDTVPLRGSLESAVDLSYRPTFTVYGQNLSGDSVPALLSGSASEWNRMVNALVRLGPTAVEEVGKFPFPSDMYSLMSLQYSDEVRRVSMIVPSCFVVTFAACYTRIFHLGLAASLNS